MHGSKALNNVMQYIPCPIHCKVSTNQNVFCCKSLRGYRINLVSKEISLLKTFRSWNVSKTKTLWESGWEKLSPCPKFSSNKIIWPASQPALFFLAKNNGEWCYLYVIMFQKSVQVGDNIIAFLALWYLIFTKHLALLMKNISLTLFRATFVFSSLLGSEMCFGCPFSSAESANFALGF